MRQVGVAAVAAIIVLGLIGAFAVWAGQPWLVPSLGSAVVAQTLSPELPSSQPWGIGMGQVCGGVAGFIGVFIAGAANAPPFLEGHPLAWSRVAAVVIAAPLTLVAQKALRANSPAGGATALIVALGAEAATGHGALVLLAGIALVTVLGEGARRAVLRLA